jgi:protein-disulfide isomerase
MSRGLKLALVGAGVVALAIVAAVLALVLGGSSSSDTTVTIPKNALPHARQVEQLFKDLDQSDNALGDPKAPVTLVEYVDPQSVPSRRFQTTVFPQLVNQYVRDGKVRVEARPLALSGVPSLLARLAVVAGGNQDKLFNLLQLVYLNQQPKGTPLVVLRKALSAAKSIPGIDMSTFAIAPRDQSTQGRALNFDLNAHVDHVNTVPTIFVGKTGEGLRKVKLDSPTDASSVRAAIESALPS